MKEIKFQNTLGNEQWLRDNESKVKAMLPETWTHISNLSALGIGYKLKVLGVDWRSEAEFGLIMVFLDKIGLMLRDGMTIKRNPHSIFNP